MGGMAPLQCGAGRQGTSHWAAGREKPQPPQKQGAARLAQMSQQAAWYLLAALLPRCGLLDWQ